MNYFFFAMFAIPAILGTYLGWRIRRAFGAMLPRWLMAWYVFWPLVIIIMASFPLAHYSSRRYGVALPPWLLLGSGTLYGALVMGFATTLIVDALALIARCLPFLRGVRAYVCRHPHYPGFFVLGVTVLQVIWGLHNAYTPRETHYSLTVHKPLKSGAQQLRIVQLSDLHISRISSVALMQSMVERVNRLQPDMIVITGDIIDSSVKPYFDQGMPRILGGLQSRYGVYVTMGNHEYFGGGSPQRNIDAYTRSNMRVLRDETLYLDDPGITLIGRDDWSRGTSFAPSSVSRDFAGKRASLAALTARADPATPWILLDHQPREIDTSVAQKIDLQFSGHTHNGQFFPLNLIVPFFYQKTWGMLTEGTYTLIVSCGFGTWGTPLRFPAYAEIVVADVAFQP
ncbi:MAG: metallophosphoesterase [Burkholderiales bacterium]|jgi:predicted MPP superfamily phosphohydrolase|nr:metallophosphoesterase [Burkholderiales bacterium]